MDNVVEDIFYYIYMLFGFGLFFCMCGLAWLGVTSLIAISYHVRDEVANIYVNRPKGVWILANHLKQFKWWSIIWLD